MLLTKLHIPHPKKNIVHRFGLFEKLNQGLERKLILVSATAGYGKTTLLCDWLNYCKLPAAWFSIDDTDNDPVEFLTILISGIQTIDQHIGQHSLELLKSPGTVTNEYIIELLINDILNVQTDFLLVLDDLHLVTAKEIFHMLNLIIERKPDQFKIAILTRSDPPLNIARLRSQYELLEIRSADLCFSESDIAEFFNKKLRLELTEKDISLLEVKTEGWIAGLQLTAITLQGKQNISEFIESIAGDNRYIMDYLIEEVLNNQDGETREFLLKTSILEKFSGSLCDTLLQRTNSQLLLESLDKRNMFIVPLDNERQWYRYHHLLGDLLKQRLQIRNKELIPDLHHRASIWYESNQMVLLSIEHAIKAGRIEKALELIDGIVDHLWETSQYIIIYRLGNLLDEEVIYANKNFSIIYAWVLTIRGDLVDAEKHLLRIEKGLQSTDPTIENRTLLGRLYETFNLLKVFAGDVKAAYRYSELAIQHIPEEDVIWYSWTRISYGESNLLQFELQKCIRSFHIARDMAQKADNLYLNLISTSKIAYVLRLEGKYNEALSLCQDLLQTFNSDTSIEGFRIGLLSSILYSIIGYISAEQGRLEDGIQYSLKGYKLSRGVLSLSFQSYSALLLAETYYKAGEFDKAIVLIEELEKTINKNIAQWLYVLANSLKCKLLILKNEDDRAKTILNNRGETSKNHSFETYFYDVAIARFSIAQLKYDKAFMVIGDLQRGLEKSGAIELLAEVEILRAKAYMLRNEKEQAIDAVIAALIYTQEEHFIRTYINEGEEIESLLKEIKQRKKIKSSDQLDAVSGEYVNVLVRTFEKEMNASGVSGEEVLSNRELDTLKLIAEDLTNQEIANELYISITTVKTHVRNILLKLESRNRSEAVLKAREMQII
jgi:LuxR family maltose regulon positive regulatory protein